MVELHFIRHAQSEYNKNGTFCGRINCNLSPEGLKETKQIRNQFLVPYQNIYCSPLIRTLETANILYPFITPIIDERLIEVSLGDWENKEKVSIPPELLLAFRNGTYLPPNAEKNSEIDTRVFSFIKDMFFHYHNNEKLLIVTHNGVLHSIKRIFHLTHPTNYFQNLEKLILTENDYNI